MKFLSSGLVVLCLASGAAFAAGSAVDGSAKMSKEQMKACDINGDLIVTKNEAMKCGMTDAQWKEFRRMQQDQIYLNEVKSAG